MTHILSISYKPEMEGMGKNAHPLAGVRRPMSMAIHTAMMLLLSGKQKRAYSSPGDEAIGI